MIYAVGEQQMNSTLKLFQESVPRWNPCKCAAPRDVQRDGHKGTTTASHLRRYDGGNHSFYGTKGIQRYGFSCPNWQGKLMANMSRSGENQKKVPRSVERLSERHTQSHAEVIPLECSLRSNLISPSAFSNWRPVRTTTA